MSDPAMVMMATSFFAACAYSIRTIANAVVKHREQDRRIQEISSGSVSDERLARLEAAVESIAIEIERISEGQRFTTKLLADQISRQAELRLPAGQ